MIDIRHVLLIILAAVFFACALGVRARLRRVLKTVSLGLFCLRCLYELDATRPPSNCPECGYEVVAEKVRADELRWMKRQSMIGFGLGMLALVPCGIVNGIVRDLLTTFDQTTRMPIRPSLWMTALHYLVCIGLPWAWMYWCTGIAQLDQIIAERRKGVKSGGAG
jgi:hypothetical protein